MTDEQTTRPPSRNQLAREHVRCPKCQSARGSECTVVRVPDHLRENPGMAAKVASEGMPLANGRVHRERYDELARWQRRRADASRAAYGLLTATDTARIAMAGTEFDRRERARLVGWLAAGGAALLVSAGQASPAPVVDRERCPDCGARLVQQYSGVHCSACTWWFCW